MTQPIVPSSEDTSEKIPDQAISRLKQDIAWRMKADEKEVRSAAAFYANLAHFHSQWRLSRFPAAVRKAHPPSLFDASDFVGFPPWAARDLAETFNTVLIEQSRGRGRKRGRPPGTKEARNLTMAAEFLNLQQCSRLSDCALMARIGKKQNPKLGRSGSIKAIKAALKKLSAK